MNTKVTYCCDGHACDGKIANECIYRNEEGKCDHTHDVQHAKNGICFAPEKDFKRFKMYVTKDIHGKVTEITYVEKRGYKK